MSQNRNLQDAKAAAKDEFYTQLTDIEKELEHYTKHFRDKIVYCNCDDPRVSNFFEYFSSNFEFLGLRKLITTCYKNQQLDLFSRKDSERAIYLEYFGDTDGDLMVSSDEIDVHELQGDGDFRSPECINLLKEADIVVTNPPFSLFREYVAQLIKYEKKFLIIGNMTAVSSKYIFPLIRSNKMWYGPSIKSGDREFGVPDHYPLTASSHRIDRSGNKYIRVKGVRWFTNLEHDKMHEKFRLTAKYSPDKYPKYDNYDAIEVSKTKNIPKDYDGVMGVPITFLDKYNPEQFEILGSDYDVKTGLLNEIINPEWKGKIDRGYVKGKRQWARILIRRKKTVNEN